MLKARSPRCLLIWNRMRSAPFSPLPATGDHSGNSPYPRKCATPVFCTSVTQISHLPLTSPSRQNARLLPSGDHDGCSSWLLSVVICTALPPLVDITNRSQFPDRLLANATRLPSGLNFGIT